MQQKIIKRLVQNSSYWLFVLFLVTIFLTGGSARNDTQAILVLSPLIYLFLGLALWRITKSQLLNGRILLAIGCLWIMMTVIYLIPVPEAVWSALPGRSAIVGVDHVALAESVVRSSAISESDANYALFASLIPMTALLLMLQLDRDQRYAMLPALIGLSLFSGLIGLLQSIGSPQGSLYFYRITNNGSAVGMFANRNHQAFLLAMLFPMLAAYAASRMRARSPSRFHLWFALSAGGLLVPLILVTGSRAGLLTGIFGLCCALWIYKRAQNEEPDKKSLLGEKWGLAIAGTGVVLLAALTLQMSRAEAVYRFWVDGGSESRAAFWRPIWQMASNFFPVGTGPGGFAQAYRSIEPTRLLDYTFLNHAHNDWLEFYSTYGVLAIGFAIIILPLMGTGALRALTLRQGRDWIFAALGISILIIAGLGSAGDYPLRTPILAVIATIAAVWAFFPLDRNIKIRPADRKMVD